MLLTQKQEVNGEPVNLNVDGHVEHPDPLGDVLGPITHKSCQAEKVVEEREYRLSGCYCPECCAL
jgi:hypothetical protein